MKTNVGTIWYKAPEVFTNAYTEKCDVWSAGKNLIFYSIGVILYIMLGSYPPFFGENKNEIMEAVMT